MKCFVSNATGAFEADQIGAAGQLQEWLDD
jgi:hypothetical protein